MREQLGDATVTAPFAGVVGARLVSIGQYVTKGQQLTSLVDTDPMKVEFGMPERFLGQIEAGQAVKLDVAAYPQTPFSGEVYFIGPQVEPATRTVPLKATVPNPDGRLRQGMFAHVELIVRVKERAVVIPDTALLHQGDLTFVYAIDAEQTAQMRPVRTGVRLVDAVEVIEGLQPGEQVVVEGHQKLHPGAKVELRQPDHPAETPNPA
jgi:membrane fusion protein (multidrug efflux system)